MVPPHPILIHEAIGHAIRTLRSERGYTQQALALKAGISRSHISMIERGSFNTTVGTLLKIAIGLDLPVERVLDRAKLPQP